MEAMTLVLFPLLWRPAPGGDLLLPLRLVVLLARCSDGCSDNSCSC
jgi:hypothetical protein